MSRGKHFRFRYECTGCESVGEELVGYENCDDRETVGDIKIVANKDYVSVMAGAPHRHIICKGCGGTTFKESESIAA